MHRFDHSGARVRRKVAHVRQGICELLNRVTAGPLLGVAVSREYEEQLREARSHAVGPLRKVVAGLNGWV